MPSAAGATGRAASPSTPAARSRAAATGSATRPSWPPALQKDPRFARCMTRKLLTYALGRGMEDERQAGAGPADRTLRGRRLPLPQPGRDHRGQPADDHARGQERAMSDQTSDRTRRSFAPVRGFTLSRRAALRGLGVSMALPWLEAMAPRRAPAQAAAPLRFLTVFAPARDAHAGLDPQDRPAPTTPLHAHPAAAGGPACRVQRGLRAGQLPGQHHHQGVRRLARAGHRGPADPGAAALHRQQGHPERRSPSTR